MFDNKINPHKIYKQGNTWICLSALYNKKGHYKQTCELGERKKDQEENQSFQMNYQIYSCCTLMK